MDELENTTQAPNTNNTNNTNRPPHNPSPKRGIYTVIALLIILGLGYAYWNQQRQERAELADTALKDIINLPEKEKIEALETKVKELQREVDAFTDKADSSARYSVLVRLAESQIELGKFEDALKTLDAIPEDKRANSRVDLAYGLAYKGTGDMNKANEFLKKTIDQDNTQAVAWVPYLEVNQDLPQDQLKALYREAITATKSHIDVMISYARFSEKIGDKAMAIAAWETAVNVDPDNASKYQVEIDRLKQ